MLTMTPPADTPLKRSYSFTERPGYLRLWGNCYDLSSPEAPSMLLRKQTAYLQKFEVTMEFNPQMVGYEAGIILWWSQFSYATMGVTSVVLPSGAKVQTIICRNATGQAGIMKVSIVAVTSSWTLTPNLHLEQTTYPLLSPLESPERIQTALEPEPFKIEIVCQGSKYGLSLEQSGAKKAQSTCHAEDLTILPPVGGAFAGVMYGIYAFGRGETVLDPADFIDISVMGEKTERE